MTWLSRLLTQNPSLHHRASGKRSRQSLVNRRKMTVESLENRTVMSGFGNVGVSYNPATLALTITGDSDGILGNDGIKVIESSQAAGGTVTVSGLMGLVSPNIGITLINGTSVPFTSPGPVKAITATFGVGGPTGGINNFDKIIVGGAGPTTLTTVTTFAISVTNQANLGLDVGNATAGGPAAGLLGVDNQGAFTVTTNGNINGPGITGAQINNPVLVTGFATIDNSTFPSLAITQTSPTCVALVELGADTIAGTVGVALGDGAGDQILLDNSTAGLTAGLNAGTPDHFGVTTLSTGNGAGDQVNVIGSTTVKNIVNNLTISQLNGLGDKITVNWLQLSTPVGIGVKTTQGDGATDSTVISNVTLLGGPGSVPFNFPPPAPTSLAGISVTQGNGNMDTATVSTSTLPGNISVTQGNGGPNSTTGTIGDTVTVNNDTLFANSVVAGNITVMQGNGNNDSATVTADSLPGNISVTQGNGGPNTTTATIGDSITVSNDTIVTNSQGVLGSITLSQGNGNLDKASVLTSTAQGNISITQTIGNSDTALVMNSTAGGSVSITQGNGNSDSATIDPTSVGGNVTILQGNGTSDTASVLTDTVGGNISVTQGNGAGDTASVTSDTVGGNVTVAQGSGVGDTASITGTHAGSFTVDGNGFVTSETGGQLTVTQGDGGGDTVNLNSVGAVNDVFNNVSITQGNNLNGATQGNQPSIDLVHINDTNITSNLIIVQGTSTSAGNYQVIIGDTSPVTVGGITSITQNGAGNQVNLGGAGTPADFTTYFLDIFTGAGGSGLVSATNTTVLIGSFLGNSFTVGGGGGQSSNVLILIGPNNVGVVADPLNFDTVQF